MLALFVCARQEPKHYKLQCFCAFGMEKYFLQHAENCVNTNVFARPGPKNIVNTVIFVTRGKTHRKYRGFGLPSRKNISIYGVFCSESFKKT